VLGYWDIRGRGGPIRFLLKFLGVDFEDKMYTTTEDPASRASWLDEKNTLGLDFPNLPYFKDTDGFQMTETAAILQYICDKWNPALLGSTPEERGRVEMLKGIFEGLLMKFVMPCFRSDNREEVSAIIMEAVKDVVPHLGHPFVTGDQVTYLDFQWLQMVEMMEWVTEGKLMSTH
jgi:glutathione S-transferase